MSRFFGNITASDHEDLVFSDGGLYESTLKTKILLGFRSIFHAYLYFAPFRWVKIDGVGHEFAKKVYRGSEPRNYVSRSLKRAFDL